MTDTDPPDTPKLCPACGFSDAPAPRCRVCDGSRLVSPGQFDAWAARQKTKRTSSSLADIPSQVSAALDALRARGTAQTAPLIVCGAVLFEEFQRSPGDANIARRLSDWLTAVQALLRGER